jgi:hypothetical protein
VNKERAVFQAGDENEVQEDDGFLAHGAMAYKLLKQFY